MDTRDLEPYLEHPIAFHRVFALIGGSIASGLFLSQAYYWSSRTKDPDGWFYKSCTEWQGETTLTRREQDTARKRLKAKGLIIESKRGMPCTIHYKVDTTQIHRSILALSDRAKNTSENTTLKTYCQAVKTVPDGVLAEPSPVQTCLAECAKQEWRNVPNKNGGMCQTRMAECAKPSIYRDYSRDYSNQDPSTCDLRRDRSEDQIQDLDSTEEKKFTKPIEPEAQVEIPSAVSTTPTNGKFEVFEERSSAAAFPSPDKNNGCNPPVTSPITATPFGDCLIAGVQLATSNGMAQVRVKGRPPAPASGKSNFYADNVWATPERHQAFEAFLNAKFWGHKTDNGIIKTPEHLKSYVRSICHNMTQMDDKGENKDVWRDFIRAEQDDSLVGIIEDGKTRIANKILPDIWWRQDNGDYTADVYAAVYEAYNVLTNSDGTKNELRAKRTIENMESRREVEFKKLLDRAKVLKVQREEGDRQREAAKQRVVQQVKTEKPQWTPEEKAEFDEKARQMVARLTANMDLNNKNRGRK